MGQEAKQLMHRERPRNMRQNFTVRVTEHWNRRSREDAESPSLDAIPCHVLRDDPARAGRQDQTLLHRAPSQPVPLGGCDPQEPLSAPGPRCDPARAEAAPAACAALSAAGPGHGTRRATRGRRRERGEERDEKKPEVTSPAAAGPG